MPKTLFNFVHGPYAVGVVDIMVDPHDCNDQLATYSAFVGI